MAIWNIIRRFGKFFTEDNQMSNPPVFARDYVFSAQLTNLAYSSSHLETGMTGDRLAAAIRENGNPFASEAELTAFARDYEVVLSRS